MCAMMSAAAAAAAAATRDVLQAAACLYAQQLCAELCATYTVSTLCEPAHDRPRL
jgi:hypothetical protein